MSREVDEAMKPIERIIEGAFRRLSRAMRIYTLNGDDKYLIAEQQLFAETLENVKLPVF